MNTCQEILQAHNKPTLPYQKKESHTLPHLALPTTQQQKT